MQVTNYDSSVPNRVLAAMVLNDVVCTRVGSQWRPEGLFESNWSNIVGVWCVSHSKKYNKAPAGHITPIFEEWSTKRASDQKMIDSVSNFLYHLSDNYGDPDDLGCTEYLLDLAGDYFNRVALRRHIASLDVELENGDLEKASEALFNFQKINTGKGSYVNILSDANILMYALDLDYHRPLVRYKNKLGKFIGSSLKRETLFAFMAPDKTGKTGFLIDLAYRALRSRNKVAYFDTGDGSEREVLNRFANRALGCPNAKTRLTVPVRWDDNILIKKDKLYEAADPILAFRELNRIAKSSDALRMSFHASSTISAADIDGILTNWNREGWRPDVVVIDYADILAPPTGEKDKLDQIDETWKQLRKISQSRHCLVVTATQASAAAYGKETGLLGRKHFSGRKTKLAHVNGMLGINVSPEEKDEGIARINWIVRRDDYYNESHYVKVAGCMAIGCPVMISC